MGEHLRDAAARGDSQEVVRLLGDGVKNVSNQSGRNALHLAAAGGHGDVVAALLLARWDVNIQDSAGYTALQRAAADGHVDIVNQLVKHEANANIQDKVHGNTPLHEASWKGYSKCVEVLCKASKVNLELKNFGGFAPLHLACQNGHNQSCRELLLANADPDVQNNYGDTALHTSARYGHAGVTRILISADCRISDQNKNGDTALHIAAAMGRRKLTRILLEAGCDKNRKNKQNETSKDIAIRKDLTEILKIIDKTVPIPRKDVKNEKEKEKHKKKNGNDKKREKNESGTSSKESSSKQKEKKKQKQQHQVHFSVLSGNKWSPYGCHYYPDSKSFPKPKLDSLPNEPLRKGEQYYLDLAGNIRKGPVGVGYTCYCAPFFKHMEDRLDRDKKELKEHIDKRVTSLEARTKGQLNEITRAMAMERTKCNQRHLHLEQWLIRGSVFRNTEKLKSNKHTTPPPLPRAKSLENILDEKIELIEQNGHRSVEILNTASDEVLKQRSSSGDGKESGKGSSEIVASTDEERQLRVERSEDQVDGGSATKKKKEMAKRERKLRRTTREISEKIDEVLRNGDAPEKMESLYGEMMKWRSYHHAWNETIKGEDKVEDQRRKPRRKSTEMSPERRRSYLDIEEEPERRTVQEIVAKLQKQNAVQDIVAKIQKKTGQLHKTAKKWSETKEEKRKYESKDREDSSESSEEEDEVRNHRTIPPNYENISRWDENENKLSEMPYRCRSAVYSPSADLETEFSKLVYENNEENAVGGIYRPSSQQDVLDDHRVQYTTQLRRPMYDSHNAIDRTNFSPDPDKRMFSSDHNLLRSSYSPTMSYGNTFYERALRIQPPERIFPHMEPAYSPTHNDSGYSTKPYGGSSTGPSPSLSGQEDTVTTSNKPPIPLRGRIKTTASLV